MHRRIKYRNSDFYCRYLSIGLNNPNLFKMCSGSFFNFLKNELNLIKLPYDIKIIDLVLENCIDADLFVELPISYFEKWEKFPITDRKASTLNDDVGYYNLTIYLDDEPSLAELSHPYDAILSDRFKNRFGVSPPARLVKYDHPNGRSFYPNEAYLSYWKSYIVFEAFNECLFIDRYISSEEGKAIVKNRVASINSRWNDKYSKVFNALSHYRTFTSQYHFLEKPLVQSHDEIAKHILDRSGVRMEDLYSGLGDLLELHSVWKRKLEENGGHAFNWALDSLKRDVYFLFEWLCGLGFSENQLLEKWTYNDRQSASWSQLKDVLDFEELHFRESFKRYVPHYCQHNPDWFALDKIEETYDSLCQNQSFEPWIRSFADLHSSINSKESISLIQPRLLDNLLVMTIRTEVLIRTMFLKFSREEKEPDDLKNVFHELSKNIKNVDYKKIFRSIADNNYLTSLKGRPESVFSEIECSRVGRKWSNKHKHFFKMAIKFVISRNYFAHHYYKDNELNNHTNEIGREVLTCCLQTILFINGAIENN